MSRVTLPQTAIWFTETGEVDSPGGQRYRRRSTRAKRKDVASLISDGSPILVQDFGDGVLDWLEDEDAAHFWLQIKKRYGEGQEWRGGIWRRLGTEEVLVVIQKHC